MHTYNSPMIIIVALNNEDVISTSGVQGVASGSEGFLNWGDTTLQ